MTTTDLRVDDDGIVTSDHHQVLLNDGTGHFRVSSGALPPRPFDNTGYGMDVRGADINRDAKPDLQFAYAKMEPYGQGRWIRILINNGDETFRDETAARVTQRFADRSRSVGSVCWLRAVNPAGKRRFSTPAIAR